MKRLWYVAYGTNLSRSLLSGVPAGRPTGFTPGDPIFAMRPNATRGAYAQHTRLPARYAAPVPAGLPLGDAAAIPLAGLTALQALRGEADLRSGAHLLVYGGSGGVGHFAVQIGAALGGRVTAVTSGRNAEFVAGLGANRVVDYQREEPTKLGTRFDVVFDAVNKLPLRHARRLLIPGGTAVTVRPFGDALAPDWLVWTRGGRGFHSVIAQPDIGDLAMLALWVAEGPLRPTIERRYPLVEAQDAHRRIETGRVRGKLLLIVDAELAAFLRAGG